LKILYIIFRRKPFITFCSRIHTFITANDPEPVASIFHPQKANMYPVTYFLSLFSFTCFLQVYRSGTKSFLCEALQLLRAEIRQAGEGGSERTSIHYDELCGEGGGHSRVGNAIALDTMELEWKISLAELEDL